MAPIGYETLNSRNAKRVGGDTPNPPSLPPPPQPSPASNSDSSPFSRQGMRDRSPRPYPKLPISRRQG